MGTVFRDNRREATSPAMSEIARPWKMASLATPLRTSETCSGSAYRLELVSLIRINALYTNHYYIYI
jgi:hypothetical protein